MIPNISLLYSSYTAAPSFDSLFKLFRLNGIDTSTPVLSKLATKRFLKQNILPDVVFLKMELLEKKELKFIYELKEAYPDIKLLISANSPPIGIIEVILQHTVKGYISSDSKPNELIFAIKQIANGQQYISSAQAITFLNALFADNIKEVDCLTSSDLKMSKRELEVLKFVAEGHTNAHISNRLFSSQRTIEGNRKKLLQKTGTKNTAELVSFAMRNKIIQ